MTHNFCIFNFTWFTNLNILDLNKYAEHQLKVQIEVFCSNEFISRKGLLVIPNNFSSRLKLCFSSQNNHVQIQIFSNVFITWITFGKWIRQTVKIKDVLWVVTYATCYCGYSLANWGCRHFEDEYPFVWRFHICLLQIFMKL